MLFFYIIFVIIVHSSLGSPVNVTEIQENDAVSTTVNPVQKWFEELSKNATTNSQQALSTLKEWINRLSPNSNVIGQNLPTMYMGTFQLLKMPMPQMTDIVKGIGDLATLAQGFNKVTGGVPLLPQG